MALPPEILYIYRILLGKPHSAADRKTEQNVTEILVLYSYKHFGDVWKLLPLKPTF